MLRLHIKLIESAKSGLAVILASKMRSFLTMLGIIIGVGGIVGMVSIGESVKGILVGQLDNLVGGTNMFGIFRAPFFFEDGKIVPNRSSEYLTYDDAVALENQCKYITYVVPQIEHNIRVSRGYTGRHLDIMGTSPSFSPGMKWFSQLGRSMYYSDTDNQIKVCFLGLRVARFLFGHDINPVGSEIRLDEKRYVVAGVLEEKDEDMDKKVIVPITTAQERITGNDMIEHFWVKTTSMDTVDLARGEAASILMNRHGGQDFFRTWSLKDILKYMDKMILVIQVVIGGLATTALLVGGIGIMNIMLASVNERIYEIGLRKAIGARNSDIKLQFLVESVILCLVGAAGGIGVGFGFTRAISWFMNRYANPPVPWNPILSIYSVTFAVIACICVGIAFGLYPAHKASSLTPVDALRQS
ncbi:FtsX-like permease family protein [Candidatus Poribacteria bacterium]|nr:FtsX-like permease family protein [Candidatus Poribacteria bacterium]